MAHTPSGDYLSKDTNVRKFEEFHRSIVADLRRPIRREPGDYRRPRLDNSLAEEGDLGADVGQLVGLIEDAEKVLNVMLTRLRESEAENHNLRSQIAEIAAQRDAAYQQAARAEIQIRGEADRANAAEARARACEERTAWLERREAESRSQMSRVTVAVGKLIAASGSEQLMSLARVG